MDGYNSLAIPSYMPILYIYIYIYICNFVCVYVCVYVHVRVHVSATWICMTRFARKGLKYVVSRHSFHHHLIAKSTDQQDMCIIQINGLFLLRLSSQAC